MFPFLFTYLVNSIQEYMYMYFSCQMNNACVCQFTKPGYIYILVVGYEYEIFSPFSEDFVTHDLRLKLKIAQHIKMKIKSENSRMNYEKNIKSFCALIMPCFLFLLSFIFIMVY